MQVYNSTDQIHSNLPSYAFTRSLAQVQNNSSNYFANFDFERHHYKNSLASEESLYCHCDEIVEDQFHPQDDQYEASKFFQKNNGSISSSHLKNMTRPKGTSFSQMNLANPLNYENVNFEIPFQEDSRIKRRSRSWNAGLNGTGLRRRLNNRSNYNNMANRFLIPNNYPNKGGPGYIPLSPLDLHMNPETVMRESRLALNNLVNNNDSLNNNKKRNKFKDNREAGKDGNAYRRGPNLSYNLFPLSQNNSPNGLRLNYMNQRYSRTDSIDSNVLPISTALKVLGKNQQEESALVFNHNKPFNNYENYPGHNGEINHLVKQLQRTGGELLTLSKKLSPSYKSLNQPSNNDIMFYSDRYQRAHIPTDISTEEEEINDDHYAQLSTVSNNKTRYKTNAMVHKVQTGRELSPIPGSLSYSQHRDGCPCILCQNPSRRFTRQNIISGLIPVESVYDTPPFMSVADDDTMIHNPSKLQETHFPAEDYPEIPRHGPVIIFEESEVGKAVLNVNKQGLKLPYNMKVKSYSPYTEIESPVSLNVGGDLTSTNDSLFMNSTIPRKIGRSTAEGRISRIRENSEVTLIDENGLKSPPLRNKTGTLTNSSMGIDAHKFEPYRINDRPNSPKKVSDLRKKFETPTNSSDAGSKTSITQRNTFKPSTMNKQQDTKIIMEDSKSIVGLRGHTLPPYNHNHDIKIQEETKV